MPIYTHVNSKEIAKKLRREFKTTFPKSKFSYKKGFNGCYSVIELTPLDQSDAQKNLVMR